MEENILLDLSINFAVEIINTIDNIKITKSAYMLDQLSRASSSIGANIHEAQYAQSKRDFISKLEIALKETNETDFWLQVLFKTSRIDENTFLKLKNSCEKIKRLLISSCTTAKENM